MFSWKCTLTCPVSSEDSFRSDLVDLLSLYRAVDKVGVHRVGIADTVGCASPRQVYDLVRTLRGVVSCDIETHFHDDTGCAIANAYCALEAGATHIDTSVLGIGERNGITPLGGLMARMIVTSPEYVKSKYKLHKLKELEDLVAEAVEINTPFNNPITGFCAFTHKAGIHAKAILNNPSTYEILNPADFGLTRYVHFASRLTGWNAVKTRVGQLGLEMTDDQVKEWLVQYLPEHFRDAVLTITPALPRSRPLPMSAPSPSTTPIRSSVLSTSAFTSRTSSRLPLSSRTKRKQSVRPSKFDNPSCRFSMTVNIPGFLR